MMAARTHAPERLPSRTLATWSQTLSPLCIVGVSRVPTAVHRLTKIQPGPSPLGSVYSKRPHRTITGAIAVRHDLVLRPHDRQEEPPEKEETHDRYVA